MSQLIEQFKNSQGLLRAVDAMGDRRAFTTLFGTFGASALLIAVVSAAAGSLARSGHFDTAKIVGGLGFLAVWALVMIGSSATGFLLNARVRGRKQGSIGQALTLAVATVHRILGVLITLGVIALLAIIAVFIALLVCKIPVLGPVLFAAVYPLSTVLLGTLLCAGLFVAALHGPAIWEGNPVLRTVSILGVIVRERLFSALVQSLLLSVLVCVVASLIVGCLAIGMSMSSLLSASALSQGTSGISLSDLVGLLMWGSSGGSSYLAAGMVGMTVLSGMAFTAPVLVAIAGSCIVFANLTENLSTADMDEKLQGAMSAARAKAGHARRQLEAARVQLNPGGVAVPVIGKANCTHCAAPVVADDAFCGSCGTRIG